MKNVAAWRVSKFERAPNGSWRASRTNVPRASRTAADRAVKTYSAAIDTYATGRLLDLGCGAAPLYGIYAPRVSEVVCVDWPSSRHDDSYIDIFADLNEPLDLPGQYFRTAIASDVLEHLHTPMALFDTAARALEPGGHFIVGVPFLYWVHEQPHDYHRYTEFALRRFSAETGFDVVELEVWAGAPEVLADILGKSLAPWPRISNAALWSTDIMLRWSLTQKLSRATKKTMPMGYTLVAQRQ